MTKTVWQQNIAKQATSKQTTPLVSDAEHQALHVAIDKATATKTRSKLTRIQAESHYTREREGNYLIFSPNNTLIGIAWFTEAYKRKVTHKHANLRVVCFTGQPTGRSVGSVQTLKEACLYCDDLVGKNNS